MPGVMEFGVLGPLVVRSGETEIPVRRGHQRALLAVLLLKANRLVPVEAITEALWGSAPPKSAPVAVRGYIRWLRLALGAAGRERISTQPRGYLIRVGDGELDLARFEDLLASAQAAARSGRWQGAAGQARAALSCWRGEPLADIESDTLALLEVPRLAELRLQALESRIDAELHLGEHAEVTAELQQLCAEHPLREHLHALLMVALYRCGRQAEALAAYRQLRQVLVQELGADPGSELQTLHQQILGADPALSAPQPATAAVPGAWPGSAGGAMTAEAGARLWLPPDAAGFTGRAAELEVISAAVAAVAGAGGVAGIYAIGGMPGVGKTALAVHAAHRLKDHFAGRVLFIDLQGHIPGQAPMSPEAALAGLLAAAGVDARNLPVDLAGRTGLWREKMAGQRVLLVLDNAAGSAQVTPLLPGGEGCLVLVTSRRHLGDLPGRVTVVPVDVLAPALGREMFTRLAGRAQAEPAAAVDEVVALAGGLPLAICLLARVYARHRSWTLGDLAAETRAGVLTLAAEQASVAAAFGLSYRSLAPARQQFFRRLGLHPGTTIDAYAAAALAGVTVADAAGLLDALHGESLLTEVSYRRYGMHDLIRRYARDLAAADPAAGRGRAVGRLLDYYQHAAASAEALLARQSRADPAAATTTARRAAMPDLGDRGQALAWARAERGNLIACLDHATRNGQRARVVALTAGLAGLLRQDGPWADAITGHQAAVQAARCLGDQLGEAGALTDLGAVQRLTGDYAAAARAMQGALGIYRDLGNRIGEAGALTDLGVMRQMTGNYPGAAGALREALRIYRDLGNRLGQANALSQLGAVRMLTGDYPGAAVVLQEALGVYRDLDNRQGQGDALSQLGIVRGRTGDYPGAAGALQDALSIYRDLGNRLGQANALSQLGTVRRLTGDYPGAAGVLQEALGIYRDLGNRLGQANVHSYLGIVRRLTGDHPGAAAALREALGIYRELGDRGGEAEALNEAGTLHRVRGDLDQALTCHRQALHLARQIGASLDEAGALAGLGRCALAAGHTASARASLQQAREIFRTIGAAEASGVTAELSALTNGRAPAQARPIPPLN